jgi:hypothetical protein
MTPPSKILAFRKRDRDLVLDVVPDSPETFPRFHKEWDRPTVPITSLVRGFSIPPHTGK